VIKSNSLQKLPTGALRLSGWIGERHKLTWQGNLLALDWDKDFLSPFEAKDRVAGLYVGLGKTIEALSRFAAQTRDPSLLALRERVLLRVISAQDADGYLGIYQKEFRTSRLWDVHELAYLIQGLVTDSELFDAPDCLAAAIRLGDYLLVQLAGDALPTEFNKPTEEDVCLELSLLGLDRALLALSRRTGDARYHQFCLDRLHLYEWNLLIVEGRHTDLEGHAYAYMSRCLAQLDLYSENTDESLLVQSRRVVDFLTLGQGLVVSGTASRSECWHSNQDVSGEIGETCATAYWIRLCGRLLQIEQDGLYGDLIERAIYNALFAAQSPDGRQIRYYTPLEGPRSYWAGDTYCCPGNYRRIIAELPEMVAFRSVDGLVVNLYAPAVIDLSDRNRIIIETDYPASGDVHITFEAAIDFKLSLRVPSWCHDYTLVVNGEIVKDQVKAGFVGIRRAWKVGDRVDLKMEMPWRIVRGRSMQEGRGALLRGPVLYCHNPSRNDGTGGVRLGLPATVFADDSVRYGGSACHCGSCDGQGDSPLWSEFADPGGTAVFFPFATEAVDDDL